MQEDAPRGNSPVLPYEEIEFSFVRSGGPGGQNVNKLATKAVLRWNVATSVAVPAAVCVRFQRLFGTRITASGDLVLMSQRFREAEKNRRDCLAKLEDMLTAAATVPKERRATRPTRGSRQRRLQSKREQSEKKASRRQSFE